MRYGVSTIEITKANGERSAFDPQKLLNSLIKAGAQREEAENIVASIVPGLYEGISTKKIYRKAFSLLKNLSRTLAARYNLKTAIMQLGPSGYPFEQFIGELLRHQGYTVQVAQLVAGKCVNHEVDVIAEKDEHHFMVECKYHNQPGTMSDVKIPLYIHSRFLDIRNEWQERSGHRVKFHQGWLVTNTRFTLDAIRYGNCAGLKMLGWDYPTKGSLKNIIDTLGLYPITTLTSLTQQEKKQLLDKKIVLCMKVRDNHKILTDLGIKPQRLKMILKECEELCQQVDSQVTASIF